jgi:aspartyl-tRNA synthetase
MLRTHTCGELSQKDIGKKVVLAGWVCTRRDHGNIIFIDIRDRYGITQAVFNPEQDKLLHGKAEALRDEYVVRATGVVRQRPEGTVNKKIMTGGIEVAVSELEILNASQPPIFPIADDAGLSEDIRYAYRYLDLRRPGMQKNLILRNRVSKIMRDYLNEKGFVEVETPILTKSTPEGARDYLVPSRVSHGKFFALPQSPQLFKQILMVSGLDKYFQIAKCFRDEDLRADRQPEFTQLDLEASFVEEKDIFEVVEVLMKKIFRDTLDLDIKTPFDVLSYNDAMARYGCDKPDRRFGMELVDLTQELKGTGFKVFSDVIKSKGIVKAINYKKPKDMPRSRIDALTEFVRDIGLKGLAYIKVGEGALSGPVVKFLSDKEQAGIKKKTAAGSGDYIFFAAADSALCNEALSRLRLRIAQEDGIIDKSKFDFFWVNEFPLFKYNNEEGRWESEHHPFTAPNDNDIKNISSSPAMVRSLSYDLVLNGVELGSGSIRIHSREIQDRIFDVIGIGRKEAAERFGFLTRALSFGAPPHGGFAAGLDRLVAVICGCDTIRDVIAFPKTQRAVCPLTQAPADVSKQQLDELGIKLKEEL